MFVDQYVNDIFTSNTYLLRDKCSDYYWLVDVGNLEPFLDGRYNVKGAFITHSHFDHIYGINKLVNQYPECTVYISEYGKKGLCSDKLNLSFYHEDPLVFLGDNIHILSNGDRIELFPNTFLEVFHTPGHDPGCLTYRVENFLFTGDSFIPGVKVVTKLRGGNKENAAKSIEKIKSLFALNTLICPGHGEIVKAKDIENQNR